MAQRHFLHRHTSIVPESEARLLHFAESVDWGKRLEAAQTRINNERAQKLANAGNVSDRLNANRVHAADVNEDRSKNLLYAERRAVLMGDTPESRRYTGALQKVAKLEQIFAGQNNIEGIKYGLQGGEFTIIAADEEFVEWALKYVVAQEKELMAPPADPTTEHPYNPARESRQEYNVRMAELRKVTNQYAANLRERGAAESDEWRMVSAALMRYKSEFAATRKVAENIRRDPSRISALSMEWKRENPAQYKEILTNAAKKDAAVLAGKLDSRELSREDFLKIIDNVRDENPLVLQYYPEDLKKTLGYRAAMLKGANIDPNVVRIASQEFDQFWKDHLTEFLTIMQIAIKKNPMALQYYPETLKKTDGPSYRAAMIKGASTDPNILLIASREFDRHWKDDPNAFLSIVQSALRKNPLWILDPSLWKKGEPPPAASDLLPSLDAAGKLKVLANITDRNMSGLGVDFPVLLAKASHAAEKARAILAIVRNSDLVSIIQDRDCAFHDQIIEEFFTVLTEDQQNEVRGLPYYEKMRQYALHTLHLQLGVDLLGDKDPHRIVRNLKEDPALREWSAVKIEWLPDAIRKGSKQELAQWKAMIARNLSFKKISMTAENVQKEHELIAKQRAEYRNVALFAGRSVLHVAHSEKYKDGTPRFATDKARGAIEKQSGKPQYRLIRPENTEKDLKQAKMDVLVSMVDARHPFTFVFDGHGGPDAIYLSDGEVDGNGKIHTTKDTVSISVDELAAALRLRAKRHPEIGDPKPDRKDILVFGSCYNASFIRALHERLEGYPKPVTLGESEFGQYGYSHRSDTFGSTFFSKVLQLEQDNHQSTMGDVFDHEFDGITNPSLYVPDERNRTQQITQREKGSHGEAIA